MNHFDPIDPNQPALLVKPRKRDAFTLIELLVVVAIIALLIAILLPALGRARNTAKDVACSSNVRQIALGLLIYSQDFDGYLPAAQDVNGISYHLAIWQNVFRQPFPGGDPTGGGTYSYLKGTTFQCPRAAEGWHGLDTSNYRNNGYAMNISFLGSGGYPTWSQIPTGDNSAPVQQYQKISLIKNGSGTLLLTDATGYYVEYFNRGWQINEFDLTFGNGGGMFNAVRHGGKKDAWNMAMLDASVRTMHFSEVPGAPVVSAYTQGSQQSPAAFYKLPAVGADAKRFWVGDSP